MASDQRFLLTRADVLRMGGTDSLIKWKVSTGAWLARQAGVYQVDGRRMTWEDRLMAAVLAGGRGSLASHRAALVLWGLDGLSKAPIEITAPYTHGPLPDGTLIHRTRKPMEHALVRGIPVTTVERTLLQCSATLPRITIAKALESALRRQLTTLEKVDQLIGRKGGRGVKGTRKLRWVIRERVNDTATDSGSETELLYHMRLALIPEPALQHELFSAEGERMLPDFYWPTHGKAVEVDGLDAHDGADRLDNDLKRQNALMDLGIDLRRFSAREVRRNPQGVVEEIHRFLAE
jgi:hypothetical protein